MSETNKQPGSSEAYVQQLIAHQEDLRAFIYSLLPNSPCADDVLQNTNLVLWKKRNSFKQGTNFHAWAFKIARYQVQHQYDRAVRETRLVFSEELLDQVADTASAPQLSDANLVALRGCMAKLNDKQREVVTARYSQGHSLEQYATQTKSTAGSLRIALYRIRSTLRRCVESTLARQLP